MVSLDIILRILAETSANPQYCHDQGALSALGFVGGALTGKLGLTQEESLAVLEAFIALRRQLMEESNET